MSESATASTGATKRLCEFVAAVSYDDIPEDVIDHATLMIRDTFGVSLAATVSDPFEHVYAAKRAEIEGSEPHARVLGTPLAGVLGDAALLNGMLAHALDFDDVHPDMGGHPSSPILSALLPVAERRSASGEELLHAFIVGTEVEITLANVLNPGHYERGWHPTAILGTLGAAVAVGVLLEQGSETLRRTVGIAASQASGIKANFGTMTKSYHVGRAAASGIEAARLADAGFTANPDVLEEEFGGFCDLFEGTPEHDFDGHLDALGDPWKVTTPRVGFKPYPCCGSTHGAIDAAMAAREKLGGDVVPDDVAAVEISAHSRRLGHTNRPVPQTRLDAKFSAQYCVLAALVDGDLWFDQFDPKTVTAMNRQEALKHVTVHERPDDFAGDEWGAAVRVTLVDGTTVSARVPSPTGTADNPMSDTALVQKYRRCASRAINNECVEKSVNLLTTLNDLDDVTTILDVVTP
ncbi:MmgE/PrpD family protein [Halarchaeum acidiphilum]|nr:MmgE/PrpD family protein [Halarchaeum acidiphilum]